MHNTSLFNPQIGHDACGVGFLAKIDAAPCHDLVLHAVQALGNMAHRGVQILTERVFYLPCLMIS